MILTADNLTVTLGGAKILDHVNFELKAGEFCGLIGSNGSGKTTLIRTILGLQKPTSGYVAGPPTIGYVPQKIQLDADMPLRARDLVALGLDGKNWGIPLPSRAKTAKVDAMLKAVDAFDFAHQRVGTLSGGQQQRILIAHALIRQPQLLVLDEPFANLDLRATSGIVELLHQLATTQNITILLSAHDMNPLLPVMDRIIYLAAGRAAAGRTKDIVRTEILSNLYGAHIDVLNVHGRVLVIAAGGDHDHPVHVEPIP
jgi:zinc/manganese transport system ATP-binding protein